MQALTETALDFGGSDTYSGVSTSRTLMLRELEALLAAVPSGAPRERYRDAVVNENVLLKPSTATRMKTYAYLRDRFALDHSVAIFAILRLLWSRDIAGQPLVALLVASFRDPLLRCTLPLVSQIETGKAVTSLEFAQVIGDAFPDKLATKTLKATAERMMSSYKQTRHLRGQARCVRQRVSPTPGSVALALLLARLDGAEGFAMLESSWVKLLDGTPEQILSEARVASGRGWLELRHAGDVLDISFHALLAAIGWHS